MQRAFGLVALVVPVVLSGWLPVHATAQSSSPTTGPRGTVTGQQAPTGTAVIRGTVVAADTGSPVRRAVVRAVSFEPADNGVAMTDDQGRFEIRNLVGGRYSVTVSKSGFVPLSYGQRRPNERGTPVEVAAGAIVEKIAIGLPRGGVITGRVMDETGEPLAEARIQILRSQFTPAGRRMVPAGRGDTTDDQGAFRIYGLPPGDYVVSATASNQMMVFQGPNGRPLASPEGEQGYAPTYYPGTPSVSDAQRITLAAGQEAAGVTFGMTPTRVSRVSGRVIGGQPGDADESFVMVMREDDSGVRGGMNGGGGMVQRDGTFTVNSLPPGRYTLRVQPRARPEAMVGVTTVTVAGVDLDGVVIAMQKPGTVTGYIEFEGGRPAGITPAQVRVQPMTLDMSFGVGPPRTNDDFTFAITGTTGPTLFRANAQGWYVKSVEIEGDDVTDTPVTLVHGRDVRGVRILLTQSASSISGAVRDERGNAVLDATVVVFPNDDSKWTFSSRFIGTARPDTQGRFELRGLPAYDSYRIVAVQGLEGMQAYDSEFLSSVRDRAERLALGAGEAKAMDVKLR